MHIHALFIRTRRRSLAETVIIMMIAFGSIGGDLI